MTDVKVFLDAHGLERSARKDAAAMAADTAVRHCRACGCTDLDCSKCIQRTGVPCFWFSDDLCSACATLEQLLERSLALVRAGSSMDGLQRMMARAYDVAMGAGPATAGETRRYWGAADDGDCDGEHDGYPDENPQARQRRWVALVREAISNAHDNGYNLPLEQDDEVAHVTGEDARPGRGPAEHAAAGGEARQESAQSRGRIPDSTGLLRDRVQVAADRVDRPLAWVGRVSAELHDDLGNPFAHGEVSVHVCRDWDGGPVVLVGHLSPWIDELATRAKGAASAGGAVLTSHEARGAARLLSLAADRAEGVPARAGAMADFDGLVAHREAVWAKIRDWGVITGGGQERGSLIAKAAIDCALTDLMRASRASCFCGASKRGRQATAATLAALAQAIGEPGLEQDPPVLASRIAERLNILEAGQMPSEPPELGALMRAAAGIPATIVARLRDVAEAVELHNSRKASRELEIGVAVRALVDTVRSWLRELVVDSAVQLYIDYPVAIRNYLSVVGIGVDVETIATWSPEQRRSALTWAVRRNFAGCTDAPPAFLEERR